MSLGTCPCGGLVVHPVFSLVSLSLMVGKLRANTENGRWKQNGGRESLRVAAGARELS